MQLANIFVDKYTSQFSIMAKEKPMFERQIYKKQARAQLANHWKVPLIISLITWGVFECFSVLSSFITLPNFFQIQTLVRVGIDIQVFNMFDFLFYSLNGVISIASAYFYISFIKDNESSFTTFLEGFALWSKGLRGFFWTILWTCLWSLLFVIPGIVKLYAYSQMFFIMVDSPKVGVCRAMKLSIAMTKGHKGELFTMSLSFLGWLLLLAIFPIAISSLVTAFFPISIASTLLVSLSFITIALISPYITTSAVYAYRYMKQDAINRKVLTYADFGEEEPAQALENKTGEQLTTEPPIL